MTIVIHFDHSVEKMKSNKLNVRQDPGIGVTPRILRDRYHVYDTVGKSPKNKQGLPLVLFSTVVPVHRSIINTTTAVAQFLGQFYDEVDLEEFFSLFYW